eukprot:3339242-Rhodomonas_salina.1
MYPGTSACRTGYGDLAMGWKNCTVNHDVANRFNSNNMITVRLILAAVLLLVPVCIATYNCKVAWSHNLNWTHQGSSTVWAKYPGYPDPGSVWAKYLGYPGRVPE